MFVVWCSQDIWFWVYSRFEAVRRLWFDVVTFRWRRCISVFHNSRFGHRKCHERCVVVSSVSLDFLSENGSCSVLIAVEIRLADVANSLHF
jgi:hypothetical protein